MGRWQTEQSPPSKRTELVTLIDFRNFIGHQVQDLLSDVGGPWAHKNGDYRPPGVPKYDGSAVKRFRHFREPLNGLYRPHHYVFTLSFAPLAFEAAEKTRCPGQELAIAQPVDYLERVRGRLSEMHLGELVQRVQEVCPLPATAYRIARLCAEQDTPIKEVATVIATDPSLAVMTLRIANSAAFGRARAVSRLEDAIVLIGLAEIQHMAMAMALLAAFPAQHELEFGFHDRSTVAGSIARVVAIRTGEVPPGEAFVCGLLCDIGAMACAAVDATEYGGICRLAGVDLTTRATLEQMRYGATSFEIGGELLRKNNLPELVARAVELSEPRSGAPFLGRLTAFARAPSMAIVNAGNDEDFVQLTVRLEAARATSDIAVPVEELERLCIAAAGTAATALRGAR